MCKVEFVVRTYDLVRMYTLFTQILDEFLHLFDYRGFVVCWFNDLFWFVHVCLLIQHFHPDSVDFFAIQQFVFDCLAQNVIDFVCDHQVMQALGLHDDFHSVSVFIRGETLVFVGRDQVMQSN